MTPQQRLPIKLGKPPLAEAIVEIRFRSNQQPAGDLLPGLLFSKLGHKYPRVESLPIASIPRNIRQDDEGLRYRPTHRLIGTSLQLHFGDRVFLISQTPPYGGWEEFRGHVCEALDAIRDVAIVAAVERYSLKCINILPPSEHGQLCLLNAKLELAGRPAPEAGFHLRAEFSDQPFLSIVQLITNAELRQWDGTHMNGLLVDIDTIRLHSADDLLQSPIERLNEAHNITKSQFFSLLTPRTIDALEPVWASA
jgi:uncharacterized protein (TIGR04255 family)